MSSPEEVARLRGCLDDLVTITALSSLWADSEPRQIVSTLADALLATLSLAFVVVRLNDPEDGAWIEVTRVAESREGAPRADRSVASARLGLRGEIGVIVAGSPQLDFPAQADRLVLDVAANQAAVALQHAYAAARVKRAQEAVRERERESRLIVESIPGLVALLSAQGALEVANRQILEYTGRTLEELQQWATSDVVHPDDLPHVIDVFGRSIASASPYNIVQRLRRSDGLYRWFQNSGFPLRDAAGHIVHWCVLLTDIDDAKRAGDALRESERQFRLLVETIPALVWRGTPEGELDYLNKRAVEYLGHTAESLTGGRWLELVHPDHRDATVQRWLQSATTGASYNDVYQLRRADDQYRWIQSVGEPFHDADGRIAHWYGLIIDIDERKRADAELRRAHDRLTAAGAELAHVSRVTTLSALTASIAHEVNQPLSGIITNASTCLRMLDAAAPDIDGARETARRTIRDGNRASDVITRLRALFSKREFTLEPLDLNEATREVIALSSSDLQRHRIVLQSELADDLPMVTGDRIQLQQVILNLFRNASDAMVDVRDRPRQLRITTEREGNDRVRLTVRDAGVGLAGQSMDSLFDAFYTTKSGGMGIGLFVSRSIVERHQGRLWAESNDGPGATFSFSIPRRQASVSDADVLRTA